MFQLFERASRDRDGCDDTELGTGYYDPDKAVLAADAITAALSAGRFDELDVRPCAPESPRSTGTNWEGSGVEPDVAVSADEAFDVAYRHARDKVSSR